MESLDEARIEMDGTLNDYLRRSHATLGSQDRQRQQGNTMRTIDRIQRLSSWQDLAASPGGAPAFASLPAGGPAPTVSGGVPPIRVAPCTQPAAAPVREPAQASSAERRSPRQPRRQLDTIQFTAPIFFCMEDEGTVAVDMMRLGASTGRCVVLVNTQPGSARAGVRYQSVTKQIVFEEGDLMKTIAVPVISDELFDTTLEFEVSLTAVENCNISASLQTTRVLIIDKDTFPSNAFADVIAQNDEDKLAEITTSLLWAYMVLVFRRVPTIWWKTLLTMVVDQLHNVYYLLKVFIRMYLVDTVLNMENAKSADLLLVPNNRNLTAMVLAAFYIAPYFVLLITDRLKETTLEMGKGIRTHFKVNLFRKYLNYTEEAKHKVPVQDLATAMDSDIPELVDGGYMFGFSLMQGLGKILVVSYFLLRSDLKAIVPLLLFPLSIIAFLRSRQAMHVELEDLCISAEEDATGMLVNSVNTFSLIRDYSQRSATSIRYETMLKTCFMAMNRLAIFKYWNDRFVPAITLSLVASYLVFGSQLVLMGDVSLGTFLATIDIYLELGARFQTIYKDLESGIQAGSPLVQLTRMLNLPSDVMDRRRWNRERRAYMKEQVASYKAARRSDPNSVEKYKDARKSELFDRIPIKFHDVRVDYVPCLSSGFTLSVPTEKLVFATGSHGTGKATLFRVLAGIKNPTQGKTLFSSHLRCIHVDTNPMMLQHLNLLENLSFGASRPIDNERVARIFYRLGLHRSSELRRLIHRDLALVSALGGGASSVPREMTRENTSVDPDGVTDTERLLKTSSATPPQATQAADNEWYIHISISEAKKINLARALVFSPQILIAHKVADDSDAGDEHDMYLSLLRDFVDHRGIENAQRDFMNRRPRTCFFSGGEQHAKSDKNAQIADVVWRFSSESIHVEDGGCALMTDRKHDGRSDAISNVLGGESSWKLDDVRGLQSPAVNEPEPPPALTPPVLSRLQEDVGSGPPVTSATGSTTKPSFVPGWAAIAARAGTPPSLSKVTSTSSGLADPTKGSLLRALAVDSQARPADATPLLDWAQEGRDADAGPVVALGGEMPRTRTHRKHVNSDMKQSSWCRRCPGGIS